MVDILLELPDDLIRSYELAASLHGRTAEDLMREIIEAQVPRRNSPDETSSNIMDEPVVKAAEVETKYRELGYRAGWRFITCPQANASRAKLLLVSLNPAGSVAHGPAWSQEDGSAYRIESWNGLPAGFAPLQRQVQRLFAFLDLSDADVFSAHWVPFRSPSWNELDRKVEAETYALQLWRWLQPQLAFERIVCLGKERPGRPLANIFNAKLEVSLPVGWGNITADRYRLPDGRPLIALPHLSRFAIFGRPSSDQPLRELFEIG